MHVTDLYDKAPFNPEDPNPWLALYLDMSLPLSDEVKAALLRNSGSKSRQFLLPLIRPCAKLTIMAFQVLKIAIPNKFTSSRFLHRMIYWGLRTFVRADANYLILRHFHIGSEILQFVATNVPGIEIPLNPLRPAHAVRPGRRCVPEARSEHLQLPHPHQSRDEGQGHPADQAASPEFRLHHGRPIPD